MKLPFGYLTALYRKDNAGNIFVWNAREFHPGVIQLYHGRLDGTLIEEHIFTERDINKEIQTRINAKRKAGYKFLSEIKDDYSTPVEEGLLDYLRAYLPSDRTDANGDLLAMLAKSYTKVTNPFKNISTYLGQWKINGLRCFIKVYKQQDLFTRYRLKFQPREGGVWNSLAILEEKLITLLGDEVLEELYANDWALDGEVYIPGFSVNEINSAVKNTANPNNKLVQFWCYDIAIEDCSQEYRNNIRCRLLKEFIFDFKTWQSHFSNIEPLVALPSYYIYSDTSATHFRDVFIDLGFEGLILRDPACEYQFGKRNRAMLKYKRSTDGKFLILDIYPEGIKRSDIPLFKLKNDINDATFEVHLSDTMDNQRKYLTDEVKEQTVGKYMFVEFGERSGVNQVPFHCKTTKIL